MDKISVIDLGDVAEPIAEVVNNFINKISSALGWLVTPKNIKPAIIEAQKSILMEIANRQDVDPFMRATMINCYQKILKEYKNQNDIIKIAASYLKTTAMPAEVNDDWINFFFDKVNVVTEDYMKAIWGKILAGEFNEPKTYSKQFLHTMSIIDSNIAKMFCKIRSSCFYAKPYLYSMIYRIDGKEIDNIKKYQEIDLFIKDFRELDNFGLIQYKFSAFHTWTIHNKEFCYGNKRIKFDTDQERIALGNVALTDVGKQLCRVVPAEYDDRILEICMDAWKRLGYNPIVIEEPDKEQ